MPLSTSNSNHSITNSHWYRTWIVTACGFVLMVVSAELLFRSNGHKPSVVNNRNLWANVRTNIYQEDGKSIVLLGASRIELGICTKSFRTKLPEYNISQLAVSGNSPLAAIRDLAEDEKFKGIVLCSVTAATLRSRHWNDQQPYVDNYRYNTSFNARLDRDISTLFQEHLTIMNPGIRLTGLSKSLILDQRIPPPFYLQNLADRSRRYDFSLRTEKELQRRLARRLRAISRAESENKKLTFMESEQWIGEAMAIEPFVKQIQSRGGKVVFIRMPTSDEYWKLDEQLSPRSLYWDKFAQRTSAETLHFKNMDSLKGFEYPDHSHLDQVDTPRFTNILIAELVQRKFIPSDSLIHER